MGLKQSSIEQKLCLYFIFKNPIAFRDFFIPQAIGKTFYTYYYQIPPALCDELVWAGARGTGKSFDLEFSLLQVPFSNPGTESVVAAYRRTHVKDRLEKVISYLAAVPYLRSFLLGDSMTSLRESVSRSPTYYIKFKNKHEMFGLSTGDDPQAVNLQGKHPCVYPKENVLLASNKTATISDIIKKVKNGEKVFVKTFDTENNIFSDNLVTDGWFSSIQDKKILRIVLEDGSSVRVTPDHKMYVKDESTYCMKEARLLRVQQDHLLTTEPDISDAQRSLILGSLLGDASISVRKQRNLGRGIIKRKFYKRMSHHVDFGHTTSHYVYTEFKYNALKNLATKGGLSICQNRHGFCRFRTRNLNVFDHLAEIVLFNGKKIVTKKWLNYIDEKALAIWFMDDGSGYRGKKGILSYIKLSTNGFTYDENIIIKEWLLERYNIKAVIYGKGTCHLSLNGNEGLKFIRLILPYMLPIFTYKVANIAIDCSMIGSKLQDFFIYNNRPFAKRIETIIPTITGRKVCDLSIENISNYIVNGIVVSNCHRFLEEAQFFTGEAWSKYQNTQSPSGSKDRYYGVSHGMIDSPFYEMTHRMKKFKNKVFRVHRAMEPNWTQDLKREKLSTLKGPNSNEWLQQIEAKDGEPSFGVWSEGDLRKCMDFTELPDMKGVYANEMRLLNVLAKDYVGLDPSQALYNLPLLPEGAQDVILGIDAGYAQPTVILPFFYYNGKWNLRCKISLLDRMISDDQTELVDYVANFYNAFLGIDCTSAEGRDIATSLCNPKNEKYINKGYDKRVYFIDFREAVVIGYKRVNDGNYVVLQDVVDHMKSLTTSILRNKFYGNEFDIYHDEELIPDFLSETQKKMGDRTEIRTPTDVHSTDAFRCFAGAWWKKNVVIEKPELEEDIAEDFGMVYPSMEHNENKLFQSKPIKPGFN